MGLQNTKLLSPTKFRHGLSIYGNRGVLWVVRLKPALHTRDTFIALRKLTNVPEMAEEHSEKSEMKKPFGPVITTLNSEEFRSLFTPGLKFINELFNSHKFELSIAGGAVRDLLLGIKPNDVDFATTATPDEMLGVFKKEGIRTINEGGQTHGTVTCRVCEENFEITTLRIDKVTDGRHAQVEFTKDWYLDASRRDLTINSMFLDLQGNVIDFFNGADDLKNRKVRFVGDPSKRICEDYLRILRFFRFFGRIADQDAEFDAEAIEAIKEHCHGLRGISGPRIWTEMTQILNGRHIAKIMREMYNCGILKYIGFPEEADLDLFEEIYNKTRHLNTNHMTYASTLLRNDDDVCSRKLKYCCRSLLPLFQVLKLEERVQFSRNERKISFFIVKYRDKLNQDKTNRLKFCKDILVDIPPHEGCHRSYLIEVLKYIGDFQTMACLRDWKVPRFPVTGKMLMAAGVPRGKAVGIVLKTLKERWKVEDYASSPDDLLQQVPDIVRTMDTQR